MKGGGETGCHEEAGEWEGPPPYWVWGLGKELQINCFECSSKKCRVLLLRIFIAKNGEKVKRMGVVENLAWAQLPPP